MATVEHSNIADPFRHEPKGISTATSGQLYIADGLGSGNWVDPYSTQPFSELYITGGTTAHALDASAGTYTLLNPTGEWTAGESATIDNTPASGQINLGTAKYHITFWMVFDTAALATNTQYFFKYVLGGTPAPRILSTQKNTAGVDRIHISASGIINNPSPAALQIYASGDATSAGTNITPIDGSLIAVQIGV